MEMIGDRNLVHFCLVSLHYPAPMGIITSNTNRNGRLIGWSRGEGLRGEEGVGEMDKGCWCFFSSGGRPGKERILERG